jgi:transcriptional regulator with XRE-family HTH domain
MPPSKRLAMKLKGIRKERGITQAVLARRAKISRVYLAELESHRKDPRLSIVVKLATALGVTVGELVD